MSENEELTNYKIETIAKGIERLERMLDSMSKAREKDFENLQKEIKEVKDDFEKKMKVVSDEQEALKIDYTKFKSKVLAWAAAGSAAGGILIQLLKM